MATSDILDKKFSWRLVFQYILVKKAKFCRYCLNSKKVLEGWIQRGHFCPPPPSHPWPGRVNWIPFCDETTITKCSFAYNRLYNEVPAFVQCDDSKECKTLCPRYERETEGGSTIIVSTCKKWNTLPLEPSVKSFGLSLRICLLENQSSLSHFTNFSTVVIYPIVNPIRPGLFLEFLGLGGGGGPSINPKVLTRLSWKFEVR